MMILLNGKEYIYTMASMSVELVLTSDINELEEQRINISDVTSLISCEYTEILTVLDLSDCRKQKIGLGVISQPIT